MNFTRKFEIKFAVLHVPILILEKKIMQVQLENNFWSEYVLY